MTRQRAVVSMMVSLAAVGLFASQAAKADHYGAAGCGLGSMLIKDDGKLMQVLAATTNGVYSNQTFGITSGTSNCTEDGGNTAALFIAVNREALQKDVSRGEGETIVNLAQIMGCEDSAVFGSALQKNYGRIFPAQASSEQVSQTIKSTIEQDSALSVSCSNVI